MIEGEETWESINQWCDDTFGPATVEQIIARAKEEFDELETHGADHAIEAVDVVICLCRIPGFAEALQRKMAINRARKWRLTGNGTGYHIPAETTPTAPSRIEAGEGLGRFGHHPDPAIDFCVEVESLSSIVTDKKLGMRADEPWPIERVRRAMEFRVGGDPACVKAKGDLRDIEQRMKPAPTEPAEGDLLGEALEALKLVRSRLAGAKITGSLNTGWYDVLDIVSAILAKAGNPGEAGNG